MTVEILYGDYFLFGDAANTRFLEKCLPEAEFVYTDIGDKPYFAENEPDLIYMGAMSESNLDRVIKALYPYKNRIDELIEKDVNMLFTANCCDILGNYIKNGEKKTEALGIFDFHVEMNMFKRFNGMVLSEFEGIELVGFMSQFGLAYPEKGEEEFFARVTRGAGLNRELKFEGFMRNNLIATYLTGPFLILNPIFTKRWLSKITKTDIALPYEDLAVECYNIRLAEFKDPNRNIV